jgi:fumarate hydratase class I
MSSFVAGKLFVSKAIKSSHVLAFPDLGMEAIYEFEVVDMPVTVAVDSQGTSIHQTGPAEWATRIAQSLPGTAVLQKESLRRI